MNIDSGMTDFSLETDPRLRVLGEALASHTTDFTDSPPPEAGLLQAAVTLAIRASPELELLVIKRARSERDPWSGHMALPGGRRDPADRVIRATAVRETHEETGIDLEADGVPLGHLGIVAPSSVTLPKLTIAPFVYGVGAGVQAYVASTEIEAVHWVTLEELRAPAARQSVEMALPGGRRIFPCYNVVGEVVWGLTYRIIHEFLAAYPDSGPDGPEAQDLRPGRR